MNPKSEMYVGPAMFAYDHVVKSMQGKLPVELISVLPISMLDFGKGFWKDTLSND
jgi:hypothetical protein